MNRTPLIIILFFVSLIALTCSKKTELTSPTNDNIEIKTPTDLRIESISERIAIIRFIDPNYNPKSPNDRVQFIVERSDGVNFVVISPHITYSDTIIIVTDSSTFLGNIQYSYRIFAQKGNKKSVYSKTISNKYSFGAPSNLAVSFLSESIVRLTWTNTDSTATKVIIEKSNNGSIYTVVDSVNLPLTTKDIIGAYSSDTTYYFRIKYVSNVNNSEFTLPIAQKLEFLSPSGLTASFASDTLAKISWVNTNSAATKVIIEKSSNGSTYTVVDSVNIPFATKEVIGAYSSDTTYYFRIKFASTINKSNYSTTSIKINFTAPTNLQATFISMTQVKLQWDNGNNYATSFVIEQSSDSVAYFFVKSVLANSNTTTINGVFDGFTTYYFRISAKSKYNNSTYLVVAGYNDIPATLGGEQVLVLGGTFAMGNPDINSDVSQRPQHNVTLSDFYIGKYEITQKLWKEIVIWKQGNAVTPLNPIPSSSISSELLPVENVTWNEFQIWLDYLNEKAGSTNSIKKYRLLTEAEWEYAARGGILSNNYIYSGSNIINIVSWYQSNSNGVTHLVGTKIPNEIGIYDMSGNVWEYCNDWYDNYGSVSQINPKGPITGINKVIRGGSMVGLVHNTVYFRAPNSPDVKNYTVGFRIGRGK